MKYDIYREQKTCFLSGNSPTILINLLAPQTFYFLVFLLNTTKLLWKKTTLRTGRNLPCQGAILWQCRLAKGPMSHGGDSGAVAQMAVRDARAYSPSCLPRTPSRRKHCKCNASPRWCEEHEVPNPIRNEEQKERIKSKSLPILQCFW